MPEQPLVDSILLATITATVANTIAAENDDQPGPRDEDIAIVTDRDAGLRRVESWERGHPDVCKDATGMEVNLFQRLCRELSSQGLVTSSRHVKVKLKVGLTLWMLRHGSKQRELREIFQLSLRTTSYTIHEVLDALFDPAFYDRYIVQPTSETLDKTHEAYTNKSYTPLTDRCLGAIDGTHINVVPPENDAPRFRSRKGALSTNVLGCCDFAGRFTYILAGWEGSATDTRVYYDARNRQLAIEPGYYYLADAGYPGRSELVIPYRATRYHLNEWSRSGLRPADKNELFNRRHSSLRNVIERAFGVVKKRFPVLVNGTFYPLPTQIQIIYVCFAIHNYICSHGGDYLTRDELDGDLDVYEDWAEGDPANRSENWPAARSMAKESLWSNRRRDNMATVMWEEYQVVLEQRRGSTVARR